MDKLISVIIPAYNAENFISSAVKSVADFKDESIEIIIVDDGSVDRTPEICDKLSIDDERIKVFHIENNGVSNARNTGIEKATGDYIMFLDADDEVVTSEFEKAVKIIERSKCDMCIFPYDVVGETENSCRTVAPYKNGKITANDFFRVIVSSTYMNFCWGKFYNKEFVIKSGVKFKKHMKIGEDVDFQIRLIEKNPEMAYSDCNFMKYRQIDSSVMHRYGFERFEELIESYKMRSKLAEQICMSEKDKELMYRDLGINLLSYVRRVSYGEKKAETAKKMKEIFKSKEIQELLCRIPDKDIGFTKRVITFMLRQKQYFIVVLILNFIKK